MKDEPLTTCPEAKCLRPKWAEGKVKRLLGTGAGLIFKGSGFYSTDYRSDSYKAAAKKETEKPKSETQSTSKPKPDSKPATPAKDKE